MTDRHAGYVIVLEKSIREDDAEPILNAIRQVRGVLGVEPVVDDIMGVQIGAARADAWWSKNVIKMLRKSHA